MRRMAVAEAEARRRRRRRRRKRGGGSAAAAAEARRGTDLLHRSAKALSVHERAVLSMLDVAVAVAPSAEGLMAGDQ